MTSIIEVKNRQEAFDLINRDYPHTYELDTVSTQNAGYKIYRSEEEYYTYICDLGCSLELNLSNNDTIYYRWQTPSYNYTVAPQYTQKRATFREYH